MFKDKTILHIVHNYNSFQKDPIEESAKYFKKVYVLVRYKPISKIVKYLPIRWLKMYEDSKVIDLRNLPDNVEVIKTSVWYWPYGFLHKFLGKAHFKAVDRVIRKNNIEFDIIHSHFVWSSGYVGMELKKKYDIPFIVTGHGFDVYELPFVNDWWRNNIKNILEHADKIITVSKSNKKYLLKFGTESSKISVITNGYNSELFFPLDKNKTRKKLGIDRDKKVLLSVGSLDPVKGHKYLIEAIAILKRKDPDILCYIIGEGSLHGELEELIESHNLAQNIFLLGYMNHEKINKWINICDVFVLPSLAESFGIVQLEAFACEKPVVATKNNGSLELIISADYGLLCELTNSQSLATTIELAIGKHWNEDKIRAYAKSFSWEMISSEILQIYVRLLK